MVFYERNELMKPMIFLELDLMASKSGQYILALAIREGFIAYNDL